MATSDRQPPRGLVPPVYHGVLGDSDWSAPACVYYSEADARPGYDSRSRSEFMDAPDVQLAKVRRVAEMIKANLGHVAVYAGAGMSTAAGIGDYGSKYSEGSKAPHKQRSIAGSAKNTTGSRLGASPTASHHALAALHRAGFVDHLVNQNHDRLPQKAGFPQSAINEIHGAWRRKNPVVMMDGALRKDLLEWLDAWRDDVRICLAVGTSMCGMRADEVPEAAARRRGLVIVNLQQTRFDGVSAIRIWGLVDTVFELLFHELMRPGSSPAVAYSEIHAKCDMTVPRRIASQILCAKEQGMSGFVRTQSCFMTHQNEGDCDAWAPLS